ncbi:sensor histidine kinase [Jiulongibacter sediminis]|jgi:signal transduction histidine kinase|uniref:sensor histidine kinase n=1 Tax=Jiulongibacter sediminis TaxID=1605367 RepID=UPI0026F025E0|nr:sensor histidine kinase [Jiulongibacter sediminis]
MNSSDAISILIATAVLFLMAVALIGFIVFYQRKQFNLQLKQQAELQEIEAATQRQLLKNSLEVQEAERRKISKDLHDDIGGLLSATKLSIQSLGRNLKDSPEVLAQAESTKELVTEALAQVRSLSKDLTPRTLENFGLVDALYEFADKMNHASETNINLSIHGLESKDRVDSGIELTLYRVVQELVNNALKHAKANHIDFKLDKKSNLITLEYKDDGVGFNYEETKNDINSGLGLDNIISRVNVINGSCQFASSSGNGTQVDIEIPI